MPNNKRRMALIITTLFIFLIILAAASMIYFSNKVRAVDQSQGGEQEFKWHYAMIGAAPKDQQWQEVYRGGFERGQQLDIYVENWAVDLMEDFTAAQRMEMAIAAKVDGIIINVDDEQEMGRLIDQATFYKIPVVTLIADVQGSERKSFVGSNDYFLGSLYGQQLIRLSREKEAAGRNEKLKVCVLTDTSDLTEHPGNIYRGILEAIGDFSDEMDITSYQAGQKDSFETEESIRELLLNENKRPDVLVGLNAISTVSAYYSIIDFNLVGQVQLVGTTANKQILDGISKGIICSTVFVNEKELGEQAVEILNSYNQKGYCSEYVTVDVALINQENIAEYQIQENAYE